MTLRKPAPTPLTTPPTMPEPPARLLLVTTDETVAETVQQLAAAAGVGVERPDPRLGARWSPTVGTRPGLVLCDPAHLGPSWRRRYDAELHVVAAQPVPDAVYREALDAGASSVLVLPEARERIAELLADLDRPRQGRVVAVTGGSGGLGVSTAAAALALRAPGSSLLVDLDPWGPGTWRVLGSDPTAGVTWDDLGGVDGRLAASELSSALPRAEDVAVLTWSDRSDRSDAATGAASTGPASPPDALVAEVVAAGARGHDWVVLDCPRGRAPAPDLLALCDLVLLLVRGTVGGVAAAVRSATALRATGTPAALVVRQGSSASATQVARLLDVPLVGEVPDDRRLREQVDSGLGPLRRRSGLVRAVDDVVALLDHHGSHAPGTGAGARGAVR